jgi:hypothetical protein
MFRNDTLVVHFDTIIREIDTQGDGRIIDFGSGFFTVFC